MFLLPLARGEKHDASRKKEAAVHCSHFLALIILYKNRIHGAHSGIPNTAAAAKKEQTQGEGSDRADLEMKRQHVRSRNIRPYAPCTYRTSHMTHLSADASVYAWSVWLCVGPSSSCPTLRRGKEKLLLRQVRIVESAPVNRSIRTDRPVATAHTQARTGSVVSVDPLLLGRSSRRALAMPSQSETPLRPNGVKHKDLADSCCGTVGTCAGYR